MHRLVNVPYPVRDEHHCLKFSPITQRLISNQREVGVDCSQDASGHTPVPANHGLTAVDIDIVPAGYAIKGAIFAYFVRPDA